MSSFYDALEILLREILSAIQPLDTDVRIRHHVINELRAVVADVESLRGAAVEPFGSFISNLYSRWGDLDISIEVPNGSLNSSVGKKRKQRLLWDLMRALRRKRGFAHNIQCIPHARVPLLIFDSDYQNISCDISISNSPGLIKSKFFLWISEMDERFRDMVLLVKEWAKSQDINNPKTGTLNSYSLSLLVIFHFQTCQPPILPPLQEIYAGNIADDLKGERVAAEKDILDICAENVARFRASQMEHRNKSTLAELFISFFEKFSSISTLASEHAICTYSGKWESTRSKTKWMDKAYPLIVEDPFEQPDNAARAVGKNQLIMISEAFRESFRKLSVKQGRGSLITCLVRPQIRSKFLKENTNAPLTGGSGHFPQLPTVRNLYQSTPMDSNRSSNFFLESQQFPNPVHPISDGLQNVRFNTPPSPTVYSNIRSFPRTVHPPQTQYDNRQLEMTPSSGVYHPQRPGQSFASSGVYQPQRPGQAFPSSAVYQPQRPGQAFPSSGVYHPQRPAQAFHGQGQQMWRPRNSERQ